MSAKGTIRPRCYRQLEIEERWGMPFWDLVRDFAAQRLSKAETAEALGYSRQAFCQLIKKHGRTHKIRFKKRVARPWAVRIQRQSGLSLDEWFRREAVNAPCSGERIKTLAAEFGITPIWLGQVIKNLGVKWPRYRTLREY